MGEFFAANDMSNLSATFAAVQAGTAGGMPPPTVNFFHALSSCCPHLTRFIALSPEHDGPFRIDAHSLRHLLRCKKLQYIERMVLDDDGDHFDVIAKAKTRPDLEILATSDGTEYQDLKKFVSSPGKFKGFLKINSVSDAPKYEDEALLKKRNDHRQKLVQVAAEHGFRLEATLEYFPDNGSLF